MREFICVLNWKTNASACRHAYGDGVKNPDENIILTFKVPSYFVLPTRNSIKWKQKHSKGSYRSSKQMTDRAVSH